MKRIDEIQFFCESCSARGCLVPKTPPAAVRGSETHEEVSRLKKIVQELSTEVTWLRVELKAARDTSKKQVDRLRYNINSNVRSDVPTNRLTSDLNEKLEKIKKVAQLAQTCIQMINNIQIRERGKRQTAGRGYASPGRM